MFNRATVGDSADGAVLGGYSLVTAENLDEALTLAKGCPADAQHNAVGPGRPAWPPRRRGGSASAEPGFPVEQFAGNLQVA